MCHGVLAGVAPHARIVDLTHAVAPGDVAGGAWALARAAPHVPVAVHLAVVDPGVGTRRRGVALRTARGDVLVGPDNGLLPPAADALGGITGAWELTAPSHRRLPVSAAFHGRDVFAPAAGAVAAGTAPDELGDAVSGLVQLPPPVLEVDARAGTVAAEVTAIDRFGNVQLAATARDVPPGGDLDAVGPRGALPARRVRTFADLAPGELGLYEDSDGQLALAMDGAPAAEALGATRGVVIALRAGRS